MLLVLKQECVTFYRPKKLLLYQNSWRCHPGFLSAPSLTGWHHGRNIQSHLSRSCSSSSLLFSLFSCKCYSVLGTVFKSLGFSFIHIKFSGINHSLPVFSGPVPLHLPISVLQYSDWSPLVLFLRSNLYYLPTDC